jgi:hypothetical protein
MDIQTNPKTFYVSYTLQKMDNASSISVVINQQYPPTSGGLRILKYGEISSFVFVVSNDK